MNKPAWVLMLGATVALLAGCATTPSNAADPLEPMNRAMYRGARRRRHQRREAHCAGLRRLRPAFHPQGRSRTSSTTSTTLFSALNGTAAGQVRQGGQRHGPGDGQFAVRRRRSDRRRIDLGIERGNEDFGLDLRALGDPGRDHTCSSRCSARRPCATAPASIVRIAVGPGRLHSGRAVAQFALRRGLCRPARQLLGVGEIVDTAALDRYTFIRNAYFQRRRYLFYDGKPPPEAEDE